MGQTEVDGEEREIDVESEMANLIDEHASDELFNYMYIKQDSKRNTYCYVYCAPCWLSIWTAARICENECWKGKDTSMTWRVRVDERMDPEYSHARTRLEEVLSSGQILKRNPGKWGWWLYVDMNHIRRRLYALDKNDRETGSEFPNEIYCDVGAILKEHRTTTTCVALVILAKVETYRSFNALPGYISFPRIPRQNEVYQYSWNNDSPAPNREPMFLGTYKVTYM